LTLNVLKTPVAFITDNAYLQQKIVTTCALLLMTVCPAPVVAADTKLQARPHTIQVSSAQHLANAFVTPQYISL